MEAWLSKPKLVEPSNMCFITTVDNVAKGLILGSFVSTF